MLFSVIIPTFNRCDLLRRTLASVNGQCFKDYEVIVVDDGSADGTLEMLKAEYPQVRVLTQANAGPGAARNLGVRAAQGKYTAFLDSDDLWFPWTLETYAEVAVKTSSPAFITGKPFRFCAESELPRAAEGHANTLYFKDYLDSGDEWRWWGVSSFAIRTDEFRRCGGFAEENMNGEDADLALKLGIAPGFVQITAPVTFGYRQHNANLTGHPAKSLAGLWHKVRTEKSGGYPGGSTRSHERWRILTRHMRPWAFGCLQRGLRAEAWSLYRATLKWHLCLGRWRFLGGFPLAALLAALQRSELKSIQSTHA